MKSRGRQPGGKENGGSSHGSGREGQPSAAPGSSAIAGLQQTHGNRFVTRALSVQRKCECGGTCAKCKAVQRKGDGPAGALTPGLSSYLSNPGTGQSLGSAPLGGAGRLGVDFDSVRVHNDSRAHAATKALDARAVTVGPNVFFSSGRYQPGTAAGTQLLSHELTHVAQQGSGSVGTGLVEDSGLEREADDVAAGRASTVSSIARTGIQRQPEEHEEKADAKKEKEEEEKKPGGAAKKEQPPELKVLDLLPRNLRPVLDPTDSERLQKMLSDDGKAADRNKGITHKQGPAPAKKDPKGVSEQDLAAAARALLARCNRDQQAKGDPLRRQPDPESKPAQEGADTGQQIKDAVEVCLDTPEGEVFTAKVKSYLLSGRGAPITVGAVSALLTNFAITGEIAYIPPIQLGEGAELSLEIDGPVSQPHQAMLKLKVSDFSSFGKTVASGAKAVGQGLATFFGWIGKALATVGGWVWTGFTWLAQKIFDVITGILGRVVNWMLKLPERLARLLTTLIEGVAKLQPWSLRFWASLGRAGTWLDFLKWLGTAAIEIVELGGLGEIYQTAAELIKFNTRSLRDNEREAGAEVFGSTIPWHLVRVDEAALLGPAFTGREYTSMHTINGWGGITIDTMIHELTHVWQYESAGAIYIPQALHAQATEGYDYGDLPCLRAARASGLGILSFNREQQAQIVQDFFLLAQGSSPKESSGTVADQPLYAWFVKDVSSHDEKHLASLRV